MVQFELSGSEAWNGLGLHPDNAGQRLDYQARIDSAANTTIAGAQAVGYGMMGQALVSGGLQYAANRVLDFNFRLAGAEGSGGFAPDPSLGGAAYLGPFYEEAKALFQQDPAFFPNPDTTTFRVTTGAGLDAARQAFVDSGLSGHHNFPIAHGGPAVPGSQGLAFTGESAISAASLSGLDLDFYSGYGSGTKMLNIYQPEPGGLFQFGTNPRHTAATDFWNRVGQWQIQQGLR
jgi:hypothetical protein